jgi:cytochrome c oxidase subunit 7
MSSRHINQSQSSITFVFFKTAKGSQDYFFFTNTSSPHSLNNMIAPIAGKFRKQVIKDITISLVLGAAGGAAWWNLYHMPNAQRRDAYYAKLEASKQ